MAVPPTLQRKMDLFRAKGRLFRDAAELFSTTSWVAVCLGQHIVPAEYEPAVDALDEEKVAMALEQMRRGYLDVAERLPTHGDFIRQSGLSPFAKPGLAPVAPPADDVPTFSFTAESPFVANTGSPV
jgi:tryptophan halogenase